MNEVQNQIFQVDTTCIKDNQVLALSISRQDVERCARFIHQYGIVMPPVIGNCKDGTKHLLSGECEFLALKEMGVKSIDAVTIPISIDEDTDKLSLLLSCIKKSSSAFSEAIFISQLIKNGKYTQLQLSEILDKSPAWVNKRVSLATRLHPAVREMVIMKQLCPHSAQEIARLPQDIQHDFAAKVIVEGISKSGVEVLTSAFNKKEFPSSLKEQILQQPRYALSMLEEYRLKPTCVKDKKDYPHSCKTLRNNLVLIMHCIKDAEKQISVLNDEGINSLNEIALSVRTAMLRFCSLLELVVTNQKISPGKFLVGGAANVN